MSQVQPQITTMTDAWHFYIVEDHHYVWYNLRVIELSTAYNTGLLVHVALSPGPRKGLGTRLLVHVDFIQLIDEDAQYTESRVVML